MSFTVSSPLWSPARKINQDLTRPWRAGGESVPEGGGYCSDPKYPVQSQCICIKQLSHLLCPSVLRHVGPVTLLTQSKRPLGGEKQAPIGHALTTRPNMQRSLSLQPVQRWQDATGLHQTWQPSCYSFVPVVTPFLQHNPHPVQVLTLGNIKWQHSQTKGS